jgi:Ca2+-binding RTX toxin-like protein
MTSPRRLMLSTIMTASLVGLALARPASARTVTPPADWNNLNVSATVGYQFNVAQVVCFTASGKEPVVYSLGGPSGLNDDYLIATNSGNDSVDVVSSTSLIACGRTLHPLVYGKRPDGRSRRLDVSTRQGNDRISCGKELSNCDGAQGDDLLFAASPIGTIRGGSGKDKLVGHPVFGTGDRLSGGSGNDCLNDPGNDHSLFDCGSGTDLFVTPASGAIDCETPVNSCPAVIP